MKRRERSGGGREAEEGEEQKWYICRIEQRGGEKCVRDWRQIECERLGRGEWTVGLLQLSELTSVCSSEGSSTVTVSLCRTSSLLPFLVRGVWWSRSANSAAGLS